MLDEFYNSNSNSYGKHTYTSPD